MLMVGAWTYGHTVSGDGIAAAQEYRPRMNRLHGVSPLAGAPSALRLVEPGPLPTSGPLYQKVAQPEETSPGKPIGPAPSVDDTDAGIKPIGVVNLNMAQPPGETPLDLAAPRFARAGVTLAPASESRNWMEYSYYWKASGFCHQPLYFEEVNLERYGYRVGGCLQPLVSAAHFFGTIPLLPYKMVVHPPSECVYTLGYYRPGSPAYLQHERFQLRADAGAAETAAVIGTILLLR